MPKSTLTLTLPEGVYDELQHRALQHDRWLEGEAAFTLAAAVGTDGVLPADLMTALDAISLLDDASLWRVSHSPPSVEDGVLLETLVDKRRRHGLLPAEELLLADLVDRHDRVMVLRAEVIALLHGAGST